MYIPGKPSRMQRLQYRIGEFLCGIGSYCNRKGADNLFEATWGSAKPPEWFDHRLTLFNDQRFGADHWAMSADNILLKMPLGGKHLSLCSGDGFYEYVFFRHRADKVICYDYDKSAVAHAKKHHAAKNIVYNFANILDVDFGVSAYDSISMRGAIEHFSSEQQKALFTKIASALTDGGYFCGDTVQAVEGGHKLLEHHEFEWPTMDIGENMMRDFFSDVRMYSYESINRMTILWQCQK